MKRLTIVMMLAAGAAMVCSGDSGRSVLTADGPWEMEQASAPGRWMPAVVPGTVLTTLVKNGLVPDPYYGLNNLHKSKLIPDLLNSRDFYTATYRTKLMIPADWKGARRKVWMRPEGINYRGEIYVNGELAAVTAGMFQRNVVDVTGLVRPGGENDIVVKVRPVDFPGGPRQKKWGAPREWNNGGDGEIGRNVTMMMTAGWDFMFPDGIRDRNTGIWRPVTFFTTGDVRLDFPYVRTTLNEDMTVATLDMEVTACNSGEMPHFNILCDITAEVEGTDIRMKQSAELFVGERRAIRFSAKLANPKLWWPRNKGPQNMYRIKFTASGAGYDPWWADRKEGHVPPYQFADTVSCCFGIREAYSDQSGSAGSRQFYVNRRKVFVRGTNWIPEAMLKADDVRMEKELRLTAESGVNLLRLWAGGIAESDRFYELCDKYGLLVWQEFFLTGDSRQPDDRGLYLDNVEQVVKRIRHHPSVVHWVGANESSSVEGTEELVKRLTGSTSWMRQSECDGVHDGSPYFPVNPMRYYADTASPRGSRVYGFSPEYGTCALPCYEQILTFMPENLLWPMEGNVKNWNYREGGGFDQMTKYHHLAVRAYGESKSLEEYARKSQAADAMGHRCLWETWNLVRNRATGVLFWYNNTPVPQLGSHAWDYDLNQEAAFFAQRNALEPLHAQFEYLSNRVCVVSDIVADKRLTVRAEVYDFDSRKVWEREAKIDVPSETCVDAFTIPFDALDQSNNPNNLNNRTISRPHFIKLRLFESDKEIASTFYWRSNSVYSEEKREEAVGPCAGGFEKLVNLPRTTLMVERTAKGVRVANTGDKLAFFVRIKAMKDGKLVVPVHYSDNYLNLLPGETADIAIEDLPLGTELDVSAWNAEK